MTTIKAGTEIYCYADKPVRTLEGGGTVDEQPAENGYGFSQNYYGQTSGAAEQPKDRLWEPGSLIGTSTDKYAIVKGVLHYQFVFKANFRTTHGWGAGTYSQDNRFGWASSADVTDSEESGLEKFNKRTDGLSKAAIKKANDNGTSIPDSATGTGTGDKPAAQKSNTGLFIAIGLGILGLIGFVWYKLKN